MCAARQRKASFPRRWLERASAPRSAPPVAARGDPEQVGGAGHSTREPLDYSKITCPSSVHYVSASDLRRSMSAPMWVRTTLRRRGDATQAERRLLNRWRSSRSPEPSAPGWTHRNGGHTLPHAMSPHATSQAPEPSALTVELLAWVAARPRTYAETMEAWRTSCPRMPVWEDATSAGLVEVVGSDGAGMGGAAVRLTALGRATLARRA